MNYNLLYQIAQNTAGIAPAIGDGIHALAYKITQNTAGTPPAVGDGVYDLLYKIAGNTAGTRPEVGDAPHDLLVKIAANTEGVRPVIGDGVSNLLYKIAGNTAGEGGPSLDSDAAAQKARIEADGGIVTDASFLSEFITDLKAAGVYSLCDVIYIPIAVKKDAGNRVSKLYDLSPPKGGISYDLTEADPAKQQLFETNKTNGKPWLLFDKARKGYFGTHVIPNRPLPYTFFVVAGCSSATADAWSPSLAAGSGPTTNICFTHYFNASSVGHIAILSSGLLFPPTDALSLGQFTAFIDPSASTIRRKGVQLGSGAVTIPAISGATYRLGQFDPVDAFVHNGPIAFAASIRQAITIQQRDAIESLLNTKYYPSTVA